MKKTNAFYLIAPAFFKVSLIIACLLTLFMFYTDEGYYNFNWMLSIGNWIPFFIYVFVLWAMQLLSMLLLLGWYKGKNKALYSNVLGLVLGALLLFWIFS